jgi:hypothetical protein
MADESKTNGRNETMGTTKSESDTSEKQNSVLVIGKLKLRGQTDDLPQYVLPLCAEKAVG